MKILVISAHPDDETLGCGGTLLKHRGQGDELYWLIVTQAFQPQWSTETIKQKAQEVEQVHKAYGFKKLHRLGFPTTKLDSLSQTKIMEGIRKVAEEINPQWIYVVHGGDIHSDHRIVFEATMAVFKPFHKFGGQKILCFECSSSTDAAPMRPERIFLPNTFSDITPYLEEKIKIMKLYGTEIHQDPLPRGLSAIRALARYRGATIGVEYAEAFMLIREIT